MGRPRMHDESTAALLLDAAEELLRSATPDALSIRALATATETSARAVYSTFGSKSGLLAALAARAFATLEQEVAGLPVTSDPASDLVAAGLAFRGLATAHPALFRVAFHDRESAQVAWPEVRPRQEAALAALRDRVARAVPADAGDDAVRSGTLAFHALCEGLAILQLRGLPVREQWEPALRTLVSGMAAPLAPRSSTGRFSSPDPATGDHD